MLRLYLATLALSAGLRGSDAATRGGSGGIDQYALIEELAAQVVAMRTEVDALKSDKAGLAWRVTHLEREVGEMRTGAGQHVEERQGVRRRTQVEEPCQTPDDFEAMSAAAMDACCPDIDDEDGHRRSLQGICELPSACPSTQCAAVFMSYMADCDSALSELPGLPVERFRALNTSCYQLQEAEEGAAVAVSMQPAQVLMFRVRVNTLDADAQAAAMFSTGIVSDPSAPLLPLPPLPEPAATECVDDPQCGSYTATFDQAAAAGMGSCALWTPQILTAVLAMLQPPLQPGVSIEQLCPASCLTAACDPFPSAPTQPAPPPAPAPPPSGPPTAVDQYHAACHSSDILDCVPACNSTTHGYELLATIDGTDTKFSCNIAHKVYSWMGAASDGGFIGNDFQSFVSAVNSGAAGTYATTLDAHVAAPRMLRILLGQKVQIRATVLVEDATHGGLYEEPQWSGGSFSVEGGSLLLAGVGIAGSFTIASGSVSLVGVTGSIMGIQVASEGAFSIDATSTALLGALPLAACSMRSLSNGSISAWSIDGVACDPRGWPLESWESSSITSLPPDRTYPSSEFSADASLSDDDQGGRKFTLYRLPRVVLGSQCGTNPSDVAALQQIKAHGRLARPDDPFLCEIMTTDQGQAYYEICGRSLSLDECQQCLPPIENQICDRYDDSPAQSAIDHYYSLCAQRGLRPVVGYAPFDGRPPSNAADPVRGPHQFHLYETARFTDEDLAAMSAQYGEAYPYVHEYMYTGYHAQGSFAPQLATCSYDENVPWVDLSRGSRSLQNGGKNGNWYQGLNGSFCAVPPVTIATHQAGRWVSTKSGWDNVITLSHLGAQLYGQGCAGGCSSGLATSDAQDDDHAAWSCTSSHAPCGGHAYHPVCAREHE